MCESWQDLSFLDELQGDDESLTLSFVEFRDCLAPESNSQSGCRLAFFSDIFRRLPAALRDRVATGPAGGACQMGLESATELADLPDAEMWPASQTGTATRCQQRGAANNAKFGR